MAEMTIGTTHGYVDKRVGGGSAAVTISTEGGSLSSTSAARTRLTALSGLYTAARLNSMTFNDMIYAIRVLSAESAGI